MEQWFLFKRSFKYFLVITVIALISPPMVEAVCPVCTVAIGAGVGFSRWLGISDVISGLWVGGLILSSSFWMSNWLQKKQIKIYRYRWQTIIISVVFFALTFWSLALTNITGHPFNTIFGIDKLVFGSGMGSILFLLGVGMDKYLRKINDGKVKFYYQKVILPVGLLLISSLIFYIFKI